jgi:hypothetical protein
MSATSTSRFASLTACSSSLRRTLDNVFEGIYSLTRSIMRLPVERKNSSVIGASVLLNLRR